MNDLLKAVIGLIVFAILLGAFIALRSRNSAQQIGGPADPSSSAAPAGQVRSVGQTTQGSTNQPTRSVPASQTGTSNTGASGTAASGTGTSGTTTTTTTTQPSGTSATGTTGSSAGGGTTTTAPRAVGAGSKPVPALW
ncbi:MAG: hypothetical protein KME12_01720 [Trichocoleus desertorum ATA4-8-CV12]|jgi:hypothetical protein|nr:hypothetical protein [Trichocoleus desertorum ATA4-8-CV12]